MRGSERFSRLVIVVVLTLSTLATGRMGSAMQIQDPVRAGEKTPPGQLKIDPPKDVPQIVNLSAPLLIEAGRKLDVAITAADKSGITFIDVQFGSYRQRAEGGGKRVANVVLTFQTREIGFWELQATPFGSDGRVQGPTQTMQINVINSFTDLIAGGERLPKIDPKYTLDTGGVIVVDYPNLPDLDLRPWWIKWEEKYAKPFDWQASCPGVGGITEKGEVLHCWLTLHPEVRNHLIWEDIKFTSTDQYGTLMGEADPVLYDNWSVINKGLLDEYFYDAYNYLKSGAKTYAGPPLPDVIPNVIKLDDAESPYTFFEGSDAKRLYLATIAHSLALEIGGFVPWSVTTYSAEDLEVLFNSHHMLNVGYASWTFKGQGRSHTGYRPNGMDGGAVIPAPPVTTFNFLIANDMIRNNHINTVGQLLEWGRKHQIHIGTNGSGVGNYPTLLNDSVWHYRGDSPAARMMSLTLFEDPFNHKIVGTGPMAWTDGCDGASSFLQHELRAVNIPVGYVYPMGGTAHSTPIFRTIDRTLSHGDDVYGLRWAKSTPEGPAQSLLIPLSKFNDWFYGPNITDPYHNVSRQVIELAMEWQANELLTRYCADKAANKTHANGSLYEVFSDNLQPNPQHYYTVQELEAMNLWGKLGAKAQKLGYCTP